MKYHSLTKRLRMKYGKDWHRKFRIKKNYPFGYNSKGITKLIKKSNGEIVTTI